MPSGPDRAPARKLGGRRLELGRAWLESEPSKVVSLNFVNAESIGTQEDRDEKTRCVWSRRLKCKAPGAERESEDPR